MFFVFQMKNRDLLFTNCHRYTCLIFCLFDSIINLSRYFTKASRKANLQKQRTKRVTHLQRRYLLALFVKTFIFSVLLFLVCSLSRVLISKTTSASLFFFLIKRNYPPLSCWWVYLAVERGANSHFDWIWADHAHKKFRETIRFVKLTRIVRLTSFARLFGPRGFVVRFMRVLSLRIKQFEFGFNWQWEKSYLHSKEYLCLVLFQHLSWK